MTKLTLSERFVSSVNENIFLAEFSFSKTRIRLASGLEDQLSDHVVRVGRLLFLYECKERGLSGKIPLERWFKREVENRAVGQLKKTISLLNSGQVLLIPNERGRFFNLASRWDDIQFRLVIFQSGSVRTSLPYTQYHISRSIGFIHIFDIFDYLSICEYLWTPMEIAEYLEWRESLLRRTQDDLHVSEQAMLGQYLLEEYQEKPNRRYAEALRALHVDYSSFDLSRIFSTFKDHLVYSIGGNGEENYYLFLELFAQMDRSELQALKSRLKLAIQAVHDDRFELPWRFVSKRLDCGILIYPVLVIHYNDRLSFLRKFCLAAKYEQRTTHQLGISIARRDADVLIDWSLHFFPWESNPKLEHFLKSNNPFRPLKIRSIPRYTFSSDELRKLGMVSDELQSQANSTIRTDPQDS